MTTKYAEKNWDAVAEKWCATQEQAFHTYPHGHEVLEALDDLLMSIGNPAVYSECMSRYCRLVFQAKQRGERTAEARWT